MTTRCWTWKGYKDIGGYGKINWKGFPSGAHRTAWIIKNGPVPEGLVIDHLCRTNACVRPSHLRAATTLQNAQNKRWYGPRKRVTHCVNSHRYTKDNVYVSPSQPTWRRCRTCKKACETASKRRWRAKQRS